MPRYELSAHDFDAIERAFVERVNSLRGLHQAAGYQTQLGKEIGAALIRAQDIRNRFADAQTGWLEIEED